MCGMLFVPTHHHAARHRSNRPRKLLVIHQNMQPANGHGMPDWTTTLIDVGLTQPEKGQESGKGSVKIKRFRATLNDGYLECVLGRYDATALTRTVSRNHRQWSS